IPSVKEDGEILYLFRRGKTTIGSWYFPICAFKIPRRDGFVALKRRKEKDIKGGETCQDRGGERHTKTQEPQAAEG
ncbi:hypothetical protein, partial [Meiothermus granaticius]|uniref:hypothetical protein n=1 Tax=Meiothermus granaticius TaxID=863370 RepID=UPI001C99078E